MKPLAAARAPLRVLASPKNANSKSFAFKVESFLDSTALRKSISLFKRKDIIFRQGDPAKEVFYIQKGSVKLIVVNEFGREAVVAIFGPGDFIGEGCLTTQSISVATAICIAPTTFLVIEKKEMLKVLSAEHAFCVTPTERRIDPAQQNYTTITRLMSPR
jgi:CRP/FNR family transcriptional regulator, cyclic AMP receptor protein